MDAYNLEKGIRGDTHPTPHKNDKLMKTWKFVVRHKPIHYLVLVLCRYLS